MAGANITSRAVARLEDIFAVDECLVGDYSAFKTKIRGLYNRL